MGTLTHRDFHALSVPENEVVSPEEAELITGVDSYVDGGNAAGDFRETEGEWSDEPDDMGICSSCGHRAPLGDGNLCQTCFYESQTPDLDPKDEDDDPQCTNCGAYRSEHGINGPCDGFTTQPGGFIVYTSSDLEEMSYEEKADAFGWDDRDDFDPDEDSEDDDPEDDDPEDDDPEDDDPEDDDDGYRVEDEP